VNGYLPSKVRKAQYNQGRHQPGGQWGPPPPFEICAPHFTFGPLVAAHI